MHLNMNPSVSPSCAVTCISPLVAFFKIKHNKLMTWIEYKIFNKIDIKF
jgi:hypothetical protein